jgi:hypothetical protein
MRRQERFCTILIDQRSSGRLFALLDPKWTATNMGRRYRIDM